jgi:hypothetical protein
MIRRTRRSLTRGQFAVLVASATVTAIAVGIWIVGATVIRDRVSGTSQPLSFPPPASASASPGPMSTPAQSPARPQTPESRTSNSAPAAAAAPTPTAPSATTPATSAAVSSPAAGVSTPPAARPRKGCPMVPVAVGQKLRIQDGQTVSMLPASQSGPALAYHADPPTLGSGPSASAFRILFRYLGRRSFAAALADLQAGGPGRGEVAPALSGAQLSAGSVAEVYSSAMPTTSPAFISVVGISGHLLSGGLELRYVTYACASSSRRSVRSGRR